ncbi:hypothetical protein GCM10010909_14540 [Acidocella aquatica]|uniref:Uncharacterized protein n=1 Tax=Acidocella aquatica TaxID=1922313 RepID=A0ABQ6A2S2_9PROT|nr:hypothetical protein [Acidocella aquatica]GLR66774.1 hypothetical protein GCM10010909_14540 [Acidocella aquatica]
MSKFMVFIVAMLMAGVAYGETSGRINGHRFALSGESGNFTLIADGRVVLHDTGDQSVSVAGTYAFGAGGSTSSFVSSDASGNFVSSSSSSGSGESYGVVLIAQAAPGSGCPLKFRALILNDTAILSKPFGSCSENREISQINGTVVVVTPRLDGQGDEVDTITPGGVTTRFVAD